MNRKVESIRFSGYKNDRNLHKHLTTVLEFSKLLARFVFQNIQGLSTEIISYTRTECPWQIQWIRLSVIVHDRDDNVMYFKNNQNTTLCMMSRISVQTSSSHWSLPLRTVQRACFLTKITILTRAVVVISLFPHCLLIVGSVLVGETHN